MLGDWIVDTGKISGPLQDAEPDHIAAIDLAFMHGL
jgi:hypothetical protein